VPSRRGRRPGAAQRTTTRPKKINDVSCLQPPAPHPFCALAAGAPRRPASCHATCPTACCNLFRMQHGPGNRVYGAGRGRNCRIMNDSLFRLILSGNRRCAALAQPFRAPPGPVRLPSWATPSCTMPFRRRRPLGVVPKTFYQPPYFGFLVPTKGGVEKTGGGQPRRLGPTRPHHHPRQAPRRQPALPPLLRRRPPSAHADPARRGALRAQLIVLAEKKEGLTEGGGCRGTYRRCGERSCFYVTG
jgi:hypothetical protein